MTLRVHHVALQVTDFDVARRFYVDVLGFVITREQPHSVWLDAAGIVLMLEKCTGLVVDDAWESPRPGPHVVAFAIAFSERDAWRDRLRINDVTIDHESRFSVYFRDPFGTRLALSHYPD